MKKTIFVLVSLCCLLAACAAEKNALLAIDHCPPGPTAKRCPSLPDGTPDPAQRNRIHLVVSAAGINPQPPVVCSSPGEIITVTVTGIPNNAAQVATLPKDADNAWILSARTGNGEMSIKVPEETPLGKYPYSAMTDKGQCVDPIIHLH